MKRRNGFTLVELLVVIAIIALLVSILMPALGRVRELARRVQCSSQTSNVGKAIAMYTNEYRDYYPTLITAGSTAFQFGITGAYNLDTVLDGPPASIGNGRWCNANLKGTVQTVGGSLYLLCGYGDVAPKNFLCPSYKKGRDMNAKDIPTATTLATPVIVSYKDCYDFASMNSCNYSYQNLMQVPTATSESGLAVYADKNHAFDNGLGDNVPRTDVTSAPNWTSTATSVNVFMAETDCTDIDGTVLNHVNSQNHDTATQNVLFAGYNVDRCDTPFVGIANDNIYTRWFNPASVTALAKLKGSWGPASIYNNAGLKLAKEKDSFLGN